jgi:hypothetical protein
MEGGSLQSLDEVNHVAHVVAGASGVVVEHWGSGFGLFAGGQAKGWLEGCDAWFYLAEEGTDSVDGFEIGLIAWAFDGAGWNNVYILDDSSVGL